MAVLLMGLFITNVDVAVVNVATPSIHERLGASSSALQLVVSGYVLSYAMLLITGARLGDMYGYRRLFLIGVAVFTLASLACGLAPNALTLIVARVVQGTGASLMVPQVLIGIQASFTGKSLTRALGFYSVALSIGAVSGQVLGGLLISANLFGTGWRPIFLINVPIGLAVAIVALRVLPKAAGSKSSHLDVKGVAASSIAVLLAVLPLIIGHTEGWPLWIWICLAASLVPFLMFLAIERHLSARGGYPLINLHVITRPAIAWGLASYAGASMAYFSLLFTLALYLQQGLGKSALYSGLALLAWVAAFGVGGPMVPRLPERIAPLLVPFGYLLLAASYLAISVSLFRGYATGILLFGLLGCGGFGMGIGFTANIRRLTAAASVRYSSDISGLINTFSQLAGVLGIATFGTVFFGLVPQPGAIADRRGFAITVALFAVTALLAAVAGYFSSHSAGVEPDAPAILPGMRKHPA